LCARCYHAQWVEANRERHAASQQKYLRKILRDGTAKARREARHFESKREAALERDDHRCSICGRRVRKRGGLIVHHRNGKGRGSAQPDNKLANLETVCRRCHPTIHKTGRWSRLFDACRECGRTDRKHHAHGLCTACLGKMIYHGRLDEFRPPTEAVS
jgi:5-methylcytosine-specific restriction endonuclease McrA